MRIGSIGYATDQGLGYLLKAFYDNWVVTDVAIVAHGRRETHWDWFPNAVWVTDLGSSVQVRELREFVRQFDVLLIFETPFVWELIPWCRQHRIKTVMVPMYECTPKELPYQPDRFICPSLLDLQYFPPDRSTFLQVPAPSRAEVPFRLRERAEVFVHNAGFGGLKGRNGTAEVVKAWEQYVQSPARLILRTQGGFSTGDHPIRDPRVSFRTGNFPRENLYTEGDVFLFPEKFNGLSLPLQESYSSGMAVMCGDRFPMNTWLPTEPMIPVKGYSSQSVSPRCLSFNEAIYDPREIAATIDRWYGQDISRFSVLGNDWQEANSWERLRDRWIEEILK